MNFIRTGADVKQLPARRMANVRADVVESLIAAIYLDAGLDAARAFIHKHWKGRAWRRTGRGATPRPNCRNGPMPALALPRCTCSRIARVPTMSRCSL
jgi:hypothetical protein